MMTKADDGHTLESDAKWLNELAQSYETKAEALRARAERAANPTSIEGFCKEAAHNYEIAAFLRRIAVTYLTHRHVIP
jgi:hypothetical protein